MGCQSVHAAQAASREPRLDKGITTAVLFYSWSHKETLLHVYIRSVVHFFVSLRANTSTATGRVCEYTESEVYRRSPKPYKAVRP